MHTHLYVHIRIHMHTHIYVHIYLRRDKVTHIKFEYCGKGLFNMSIWSNKKIINTYNSTNTIYNNTNTIYDNANTIYNNNNTNNSDLVSFSVENILYNQHMNNQNMTIGPFIYNVNSLLYLLSYKFFMRT